MAKKKRTLEIGLLLAVILMFSLLLIIGCFKHQKRENYLMAFTDSSQESIQAILSSDIFIEITTPGTSKKQLFGYNVSEKYWYEIPYNQSVFTLQTVDVEHKKIVWTKNIVGDLFDEIILTDAALSPPTTYRIHTPVNWSTNFYLGYVGSWGSGIYPDFQNGSILYKTKQADYGESSKVHGPDITYSMYQIDLKNDTEPKQFLSEYPIRSIRVVGKTTTQMYLYSKGELKDILYSIPLQKNVPTSSLTELLTFDHTTNKEDKRIFHYLDVETKQVISSHIVEEVDGNYVILTKTNLDSSEEIEIMRKKYNTTSVENHSYRIKRVNDNYALLIDKMLAEDRVTNKMTLINLTDGKETIIYESSLPDKKLHLQAKSLSAHVAVVEESASANHILLLDRTSLELSTVDVPNDIFSDSKYRFIQTH